MAETEPPLEDKAPSGLIGKLRAWARVGRRRDLLIGGGFGLGSLVTVILWLTAAEIAVAPEAATVDRALQALDNDDPDLARSIVGDLQDTDSLSAADFGGALFVLGAVKVHDAERQWSEDRSRTDFFVASKYLDESRSIGFPEGREARGLYLLGKALIESRQLESGVEMLLRAVAAGADGQTGPHLLLAEAYFYAPRPDYKKTVSEIDIAVADPRLSSDERSAAMLLRSEALAALGEGVEAQRSAAEAGGTANPARRAFAEGKALLAQLETAPREDSTRLAAEANAALERARHADKLSTAVSRQSNYLRARITQILSERYPSKNELREQALEAYDKVRRTDGASPAGIAAALAEAAMLQEEGDDESALSAYRRALESITDPISYRSGLMPLSEVRMQIRAAHSRFLEQDRYGSAMRLLGWSGHVLGETEKIALGADTLERWGEFQIDLAGSKQIDSRKALKEGRKHLRAAGMAYERLAEARYATRQFTDDLWKSAESFSRGQGYADTIRVLNRYLRGEPIQRNALALLKLGEAHLARGEDEAAISAFQECLEFHANDASSFEARVECAKAYRGIGDLAEAEALLRYNLKRTALTPESPEWRESSFLLGLLLSESERHDEAIVELEEAIERYRKEPFINDDAVRLQVRTARYRVATSHREAAMKPLERLKEAKTINDEEIAREAANKHLEASLKMFREVQGEITKSQARDELDRVTQRNCYVLSGDVLFKLGRYAEAHESFSNISTLYQKEPYMLEALVHIYHCWRRQKDYPKARGVIRQAQLLLEQLPPDADFASSTNLTRTEWDRLLKQLDKF